MASILEPILNELREEIPATRSVLERIPQGKLSWKPHPKSRTLGELAMHVANIPAMAEKILNTEEFTPSNAPAAPPNSIDEIRSAFEKNVSAAQEALKNASDETARGNFRFLFRGKEIFKKPRTAALRTNLLNHLYHHRGQLSVYLRLIEAPVPVVYGPTADENPFA